MNNTVPPNTLFKNIWQKVPPEEQTEIMLGAQRKAIEACALVGVFGCTASFSLSMPWIFLCIAMLLPVLFQVLVTRTWVETKPLIIARYFLATRTAEQYAACFGAKPPKVKSIFYGSLLPLREPNPDIDPEFATEYEEEEAVEPIISKDVWVSLFPDHVLMFSENPEGARLEFQSSILHDFSAAFYQEEGQDDKSTSHQLVVETLDREGIPNRWLLTSPHVSALQAFERKIRFFSQRAQALAEQENLSTSHPEAHSLFASNQLDATLEASPG